LQIVKSKNIKGILFIDLNILFFLIIMPLSYLNWEKYFLPVIPLAIIPIINQGIFTISEGSSQRVLKSE